MTCNVEISNSGIGEDITEKGVCYSYVNPTPTIFHQKVQSNSTTAANYSVTLTNLCSGTTYYIRPYIATGTGIKYGSVTRVTTTGTTQDKSAASFYGTYIATGLVLSDYSATGNQQTWSDVIVKPYASTRWGNGVVIEGLFNGSHSTGQKYFTVLGCYDTSLKCIRIYNGWQFTGSDYYFYFPSRGNGNTPYLASCNVRFIDLETNERTSLYGGSGYNNASEFFLVMRGDGSLELVGANDGTTSDTYYANGFRFHYYQVSDDTDYGYFSDVMNYTLSKTSSTYSAPNQHNINVIDNH